MSLRQLDRIFRPERVAVIGASDDPAKVGFTILRNLLGTGFAGTVNPINARRESIQGIRAWPSLRDLPQPPDLAIVCTPAAGIPQIVRECGETGVGGMVIVSAGFREAGADGRALEEKIREEQRRFEHLRIIGPNCLGVIAPHIGLNASFAADTPQPGHIALISQSGALCTSLLDWAVQQQIGFSAFVSVGNMLDIGFGELIDYFGSDPATKSIILYIESLTDARRFMSAARAFSRTKPIVAYKAGRFAESAQAATSHTGAMAGEDAVCDAALARAGIERIFEMREMFDCAELLARQKLPHGPRLAIVTNAGGPGVMATDTLVAAHGELAKLSDATRSRLDALLPAWWSHGNPIDVLGDAPPDRFAQAVECVLADQNVDAVLAILTPQAMTDPSATATKVAAVAQKSAKPVLASWIGGRRVEEGDRVLSMAGLPTYPTPEAAVSAFMHLVSYGRNLDTLYETPLELPIEFSIDPPALRARLTALAPDRPTLLSEKDSKELLAAYGIPTVPAIAACTADEAAQTAAQIGYPVALKILSPQITHKTDVGGVALDIRNEASLRTTFAQMQRTVREKRPDAEVAGVTVQKMCERHDGVELIVGMKTDPTFGAVMMVGAGGITAELYRDRTLALPPLNERLASRMLHSLRSWPLLDGYRGKPKVNVPRLIEILMRLSYLTAHHPEIREFDVNPLLVTASDVVALDARVVVDLRAVAANRPFAHLAIRPYPEEFVKRDVPLQGKLVTFRPIRPEDEPAWFTMVGRCSPETLHSRFQSFFKHPTHDIATRFCVLDYDRELAIVAEVEGEGLVGIARLTSDADFRSAEFAILVIDAWQNKSLGLTLTDYCLEIARQWGVKQVFAETSLDNARMISIFEQRGFQVDRNFTERVVFVRKTLDG